VIEALRTSILVPHDHLHIKHERKSCLDVGAALSFIRRPFNDIAAIQLEPLATCWAQQWHGLAGWPPCGFEIGAVVRAHYEVHLLQDTPHRDRAVPAQEETSHGERQA